MKTWIYLLFIFATPLVHSDEGSFKKILTKFETKFSKEVESHGGKLVIQGLWDSDQINAHAYRKDDLWGIRVHGGLFRHEGVTLDGFYLVLCHELGHHLGGKPRKRNSWSSFEGQADYWASQTCLKNLWEDDYSYNNDNPEVLYVCKNTYQQDLCARIVGSSYKLLSLFSDQPLSFWKKDPTEVSESYPHHLSAQCRLDTLIAGALCEDDICEDKEGAKPRCWFNPKDFL